ncbi:MAG: TIGR00341 family protein [Pseudomonadota bacterium]
MPLRLIEIISDGACATHAKAIAERHGAYSVHGGPANEDGKRRTTVLIGKENQQDYLDALQDGFGKGDWRIVLTSVEAAIPDPEQEKRDAEKAKRKAAEAAGLPYEGEKITDLAANKKPSMASREELYNEVTRNARLDQNYLILVVLSAVVAAIGLASDNVAVVIGAMVIAPLLGPNLAMAVGSALGDRDLMIQAGVTNLVGLGITLLLTIAVGMIWDFDALASDELLSRTEINLAAIALALASGAASVLSLTSGLSSTLVGVMVAVALMPPAATAGITLGAGKYDLATNAGLLLAVNIVSVNLTAQMVLLFRGFRPRTWHERKTATQSVKITIFGWGLMLAILTAIVLTIKSS